MQGSFAEASRLAAVALGLLVGELLDEFVLEGLAAALFGDAETGLEDLDGVPVRDTVQVIERLIEVKEGVLFLLLYYFCLLPMLDDKLWLVGFGVFFFLS